jgi:hypothetical protein
VETLGPTLRDAIFDLADLKWRKRRLQRYVQTTLYLNTFNPTHPAFNEEWGLCMFIRCLKLAPETCFEHAEKCIRPFEIQYLKQKFPRSNYQSTSQWVEAVIRGIFSDLLPATQIEAPDQPEMEKAAREWKAEQKAAGSVSDARELLEYESRETERLDARIVRQIKFLFELKTMEEMLHKT